MIPMQNNVLSLLMAILPVCLYAFIVYIMVPKNYLSHRRSMRYFVTGAISPLFVVAFNYAFPIWGTPISSLDPLKVFGYNALFQVGFVEEIAKFLTFWWVFSQRKSAINDLPVATIYYAMMSSAGFAIVENVQYLMVYGNGVLFVRAISAILMHLIVGIFMGYYIQMGFSKIMMTEKYSRKEIFKMNLHKWKHILTGILLAAVFHAIYDVNLLLPFNTYPELFLFIILFLGLLICNFMIKDGIKLSKELRSKNYNKDLEYF